MRNALKYLAIAASTGFGLGLSPIAPGTAGALLGILIIFCLSPVWTGPVIGQICCSVILAAAAVPLCGMAEKHFNRKDDCRIVADEYLTFPICTIGLPIHMPVVLIMAFLSNRLFDVIKPPPARRLQNLPGGFGIVADDAVSVLYSLALNHIIQIILKNCGG